MILSPDRIQQKQRGFSLLEILVAFTILALSLGVLFQIYSRGARTTALTDGYTQAVAIAQSQLAALRVEEKLEIGEITGKTEQDIHWEVRISEFDDPDKLDELRHLYKLLQVEVDVRWDTLGKEHEYSLQTLRLEIAK